MTGKIVNGTTRIDGLSKKLGYEGRREDGVKVNIWDQMNF